MGAVRMVAGISSGARRPSYAKRSIAAFGLLLARIVTTGAGAVTGFRLEPVVPTSLALLALLVSPLVGLVASLLPARRAAQLAPARALATWSQHV